MAEAVVMYRHFIRGPDVSPEVIWPVSLYHVHAPSLVSLTPGMTPGRAEDLARAAAEAVIKLGPPSGAGKMTTKKAIYFDETSSESDNTSRRPSLTKSTLPPVKY